MEPETKTGVSDAKSPLLEAWRHGGSGRRGRLSRRNSANSLRNDFISRLPDNVQSAVDPESPSSYFDVSRVQGLSQGQKDYYERQFATLKSFEDVDTVVLSEEIDEEDRQEQAQHERAMMISSSLEICPSKKLTPSEKLCR